MIINLSWLLSVSFILLCPFLPAKVVFMRDSMVLVTRLIISIISVIRVSHAYGAFCQMNNHHLSLFSSWRMYLSIILLQALLELQMSSLLFTVLRQVSLSYPVQHLSSGAHVNTLLNHFTKEQLPCLCDRSLICRGEMLRPVVYIESPKNIF